MVLTKYKNKTSHINDIKNNQQLLSITYNFRCITLFKYDFKKLLKFCTDISDNSTLIFQTKSNNKILAMSESLELILTGETCNNYFYVSGKNQDGSYFSLTLDSSFYADLNFQLQINAFNEISLAKYSLIRDFLGVKENKILKFYNKYGSAINTILLVVLFLALPAEPSKRYFVVAIWFFMAIFNVYLVKKVHKSKIYFYKDKKTILEYFNNVSSVGMLFATIIPVIFLVIDKLLTSEALKNMVKPFFTALFLKQ